MTMFNGNVKAMAMKAHMHIEGNSETCDTEQKESVSFSSSLVVVYIYLAS